MKRLYLILFSTLFLFAPLISAQEIEEEAVSGQELLDACNENAVAGSPNHYCMQYVFGLVQMVTMLEQMDPQQGKLFCINPNEISLEEATLKVQAWLEKQPERLQEDAYKLVSESLNANYPCRL